MGLGQYASLKSMIREMVSLLAGFTQKNNSTDFYKIRWKCGTWATEETISFW